MEKDVKFLMPRDGAEMCGGAYVIRHAVANV